MADSKKKLRKIVDECSEKLSRIETAIESIAQEKQLTSHLLSSKEVCDYLHISRRTLARLTSSGEIRFTKSGRKLLFVQEDVDRFLEDRKEGGAR